MATSTDSSKGSTDFANAVMLWWKGPHSASINCFAGRDIEWHGVALKRPDWSDHSHSLAFTLRSLRSRFLLHGILNAYWESLTFELPPMPAEGPQAWRRCIDTALDSPDDICPWETAPVVTQASYVAQPRSVILLALALEGSTGSVRQVE